MLYYEDMQIKTYLHNFFLIFFLFNMISCSLGNLGPEYIPKVYKLDIQQGNEITSEMLMKLKPGMTKAQVRFVLGTPLIQDTFHSERWDYVYIMRVDEILIEQRHVILNFVDEKLKNITGEVVPKKDNVQLGDELQKKKPVVGKEGFDESLVGVQDEKKDNNELQPSDEEVESLKPETLSPLIEDTELLTDKEPKLSIDTSESINEAIKQDIIDSLPEKDDAGYFDLLLEKIGF